MLHMHVSVQWHDEIDDAHVYEMKCTFVGAKHLGCYSPPPLRKNLVPRFGKRTNQYRKPDNFPLNNLPAPMLHPDHYDYSKLPCIT